jgi:hypothetical protein
VAFHRLVAWPDERFEATSLRRIVTQVATY